MIFDSLDHIGRVDKRIPYMGENNYLIGWQGEHSMPGILRVRWNSQNLHVGAHLMHRRGCLPYRLAGRDLARNCES